MSQAEVVRLQDSLQKSTAYLEQRGIELARREAEWMFCDVLNISRMELYTQFDMPLDFAQAQLLREMVQRRAKREPLAYVLGNQAFCDLTLKVSPAVLVPRPETEELVSKISTAHKDQRELRVHDIGTGSGAIALALKKRFPTWQMSASDLSEDALAIAKENARSLNLDVDFMHADLCEALNGQYDIIVANLPYVAESERDLCDPEIEFEPSMALFADDEGLFLIKQLISAFPNFAKQNGQLWLEYGFRQAPAIKACAQDLNLSCDIFNDISGNDRMACIYA